jgi:hypothetical protein
VRACFSRCPLFKSTLVSMMSCCISRRTVPRNPSRLKARKWPRRFEKEVTLEKRRKGVDGRCCGPSSTCRSCWVAMGQPKAASATRRDRNRRIPQDSSVLSVIFCSTASDKNHALPNSAKFSRKTTGNSAISHATRPPCKKIFGPICPFISDC